MRKKAHRSAVILLTLAASLIGVVPQAQAAESIPELQWPAVEVGRRDAPLVTSPTSSVTAPCATINGGQNLVTYNASGQLVRQLDRTVFIDGVPNCITDPVVDKNDVLYGFPRGYNSGGTYMRGPNLLAYAGNTLKWKYPLTCSSDQAPDVVVGANGNIYATAWLSDGLHLIGLAPELAAGQTQPTKVLDVKIPNDCSTQLTEYKDGIFLHGQSNGHGRYYSYSGKYLGQATIGNIWSERINADGRLYVTQSVAGSTRAVNVSMYDPRTGAVMWTTLASTPGANVTDEEVIPLAGNGLLVRLRQQKMVGGMPAVPTEYVQVLVTLNSAGVKIQIVELPNVVNGNTFGGTYVNADTYGRAIVTREMAVKTTVSYPTTVPGVALGLYDPLSGTFGYQNAFMGDLQKAGGPSGYRLEVMHYRYAVRPVSNTVYLTANCDNNCTSTTKKLFAVKVTGMGIDYPRGEVLTTPPGVQRVPRSYMALGDSFSSGEGVVPFVDGTACHRSALSYAHVNGLNPSSSLQLDRFVACSGAQTTHVLNGWNDSTHAESSQVSALSSGSPKVVTITIGGNDIGFADFAKACVLDTCNFGSGVYASAVNAINNTLPAKLEATYKKMLEVTNASGTNIYVLGYPHVIADKSVNAPGDARCFYMYESVPVAEGRYWEDARAARDVVDKLNAKIVEVVNKVRALNQSNQRLTLVPATGGGSPFTGHELCSAGDAFFQNVDQAMNGLPFVFHPNANGQAAYATMVRQAIGE